MESCETPVDATETEVLGKVIVEFIPALLNASVSAANGGLLDDEEAHRVQRLYVGHVFVDD